MKTHDNQIKKFIEGVGEISGGIATGEIKQPFLFSGPPGCGKTTAFKREMRANNRAYREIKSASPEGLANALDECAATNTVALLDDANDVLRSKQSCQLLMTATLPQNKGETRTWDKPLAKGNKRIYKFDGLQMIIMTNLRHDDLLSSGREDFRALFDTRLRLIECVPDRETEFCFAAYMAVVKEYLKPLGYSRAQVNLALEYFTLHRDRIPSLSLRTLEELLVLIGSAPNTWRDLFRLDEAHRKIFATEVPQIIAAPHKPRNRKAVLPRYEKATRRPRSFFCSLDDNPDNDAARAALDRAREMVLSLATQGWAAPMICEQVEFETFVEARETTVREIMKEVA